ncbi:hypothetical protein OQA88_2069 [Cercophora sp. LCS_1]
MALKFLTLSLAILLGAYLGPHLQPTISTLIATYLHPPPRIASQCPPHAYTTQIISLSPILIHISNFTSPNEATHLISHFSPLLEPSPIISSSHLDTKNSPRTSWSAPLPANDPVVSCILSRASHFIGTILSPGRDTIGAPQMVRYTPGQKFDLHTDWFAKPRVEDEDIKSGRRRMYNRVATIFVNLEANHTAGGETWFPRVKSVTPQNNSRGGDGQKASGDGGKDDEGKDGGNSDGREKAWREHEDGGVAFKATRGSALFWVNLLEDGSGDPRTVHAGLPVVGGVKYGMNIWPKVYFGPDA